VEELLAVGAGNRDDEFSLLEDAIDLIRKNDSDSNSVAQILSTLSVETLSLALASALCDSAFPKPDAFKTVKSVKTDLRAGKKPFLFEQEIGRVIKSIGTAALEARLREQDVTYFVSFGGNGSIRAVVETDDPDIEALVRGIDDSRVFIWLQRLHKASRTPIANASDEERAKKCELDLQSQSLCFNCLQKLPMPKRRNQVFHTKCQNSFNQWIANQKHNDPRVWLLNIRKHLKKCKPVQ
jgi:hypothetical protein